MPDVEIRFLGSADEAEHAVADLDRALEVLKEIIESVQRALGDLKIGSGTVARIQSEAAVINRALESVEDQAHDTARALSMQGMAAMGGPSLTMIGSAMRGMPFVGYPGARGQGSYATPLSGVQSYTPPPPRPLDQSALNMALLAEAARYRPSALELGFRGMSPDIIAATMMGGFAGRGGGGGGGGGMGLLAALGWGRGGFRLPLPFVGRFGMMGGIRIPGAGFGSALGLAGFGAERLLGSTLGIAGSMGGAVLGGGAYALGALGTAAVGMGTDMAGIGQAAGDIKTVSGDLSKLSQAVAQYGKNSREAAAAQAQLNLDLKGFSPVARLAVLHAAHASQHFKAMFDFFTGPAERRGANIITQGIQTGQAFLPTIGKYAYENMGIVQRGLQPLFGWLKQGQTGGQLGGLGIFQDLEQMFQKRLPTAVHAGTQAFEVFLHAVDDAAHHTGGFMKGLDQFFTKLNTPGGLARMDQQIANLIGLFHSWMGLLGSVGKLVFALFKPAVGLGQDFADQLHRLVDLTRRWLGLTSTQSVVHSLFAAHKAQLDAIFQVLRALAPVLFAAIGAFAQVETVVTKLTVGPLKVLADLISAITRHPLADKILGWFLAIVVVDRGLTTMIAYLKTLAAAWGIAGGAAAASAVETDAALATEDAALAGTTGQVGILKGAFLALGGQGVLSALSGLGARIAALAGPITVAILAVYALDKAIAKLTGFDALKKAWGSAGWGADNAGGDIHHGKNPWPVGSGAFAEWKAGYAGAKGGTTIGDGAGGKATVDPSSPYYKAGQRAHHHDVQRAHHGGGAGGSGQSQIVAEAKAYGVGSGGTYQWGGGHGGAVHPGAKLDCSGYVWQVFNAAGFKGFPGTSVSQWQTARGTNWGSFHVNPAEAEPGDVVFSVGGDPPSPGHVGIVTSGRGGGARVMQYYETGKPPDTISLNSIGDLVGIKRFFKVKKGAAGGGSGGAGYNPGGAGYDPGSTKIPGGSSHHGAAGAQLPMNLQTAIDKAATTPGAHDDIKALDNAIEFVRAKIRKLVNAHASLKKLDPWYQLLAQLQGELRSASGGGPQHHAHATAASLLSAERQARQAIQQISKILGGNFSFLSGINPKTNPDNIMAAHPLATAEAHWDPLLQRWKKQLAEFEKELKDKLLSPGQVAVIRQRIDAIKKHITDAFSAIRQAAQEQFQAATTAWDSFTQAFDSNFQSGSSNAGDQLTAARNKLGQLQQAYAIDQAQSAVLGGPASSTMAATILNQMSTVLAGPAGQQLPYTQKQIDNWLQLWGDYYAAQGYTPQEMYAAFNKLLKSVGLPEIDNPFDTGGLPLPPDPAGTVSGAGTTFGPGGPKHPAPFGGGGSAHPAADHHAAHHKAHQHRSSRGHHHHKVRVHHHHRGHHGGGYVHGGLMPMDSPTAAGGDRPVNIEIVYEKGLEWLDKHVKVIVDGEIQLQGRKANSRARSGRT